MKFTLVNAIQDQRLLLNHLNAYAAYHNISYVELAKRIGICTTTLINASKKGRPIANRTIGKIMKFLIEQEPTSFGK